MGDKKKLQVQITGDSKGLQNASNKANKSMGTLGKSANKLGGSLAAAFGGAVIIAGIGNAISKIAEFESTMRRVAIISKGSEEELSKLAKTLGSKTVFTAQQAGSAMTFLAQAGFNSNQILKATPGILELAAAAQLDLSRAADIATNVLSAYGLEASEINRINDILVTTTNNANTNVEQFAEAFKVVGPLAKAAGVSINELAGFIGVMGDAGLQGSLAGTALRGSINRLIRPSDDAQKVLSRLNVATEDSNGKFRGLTAIFKDLGKAGLSAKDALSIFERQAATGALVMAAAAQKAEALAIKTEEVGAAGDQADKQIDTLKGDITKLGSAWEAAILSGTGMIEVFRSMTQAGTSLVQIFSGQSSPEGKIGALQKKLQLLDEEVKTQTLWDVIKGGASESRAEIEFLKGQIVKLTQETKSLELAGKVETDFYNAFFGKRDIEKDISLLESTDPIIRNLLGLTEKVKEKTDESEESFNAQNTALEILEQRANAAAVQLELLSIANNEFDANTKGEEVAILNSALLETSDSIGSIGENLIATNTLMGSYAIWQKIHAKNSDKLTSSYKKQQAVLQQGILVAINSITFALARSEGAWKSLGNVILATVQQIINAMLAKAIASMIAGESSKGLFGLVTAAIGISIITSMFNSLPGFATGTNYAPGGLALVGERGPEVVNLPRGSKVTPNHLSGGIGGGTSIVVNGFVGNEFELARQIDIVIQNQSSNVNRTTF